MSTLEQPPSAATGEEPREPRAKRADARRNRERILDAAALAFAEGGTEVGVAEIARRAGVGTGTLFRHFATKHDLLVAVMLDRCEEMRDALRAAHEEPDPWTALVRVLSEGAQLQARDRCFKALKTSELMSEPSVQALSRELFAQLGTIVERAKAAGVLREDVVTEDLPQLTDAIGNVAAQWSEVRPDLWRRYLTIILDGLRPGGSPLDAEAPTLEDLYAGFGCPGAAAASTAAAICASATSAS
ncbi:MAG: transcriptional regulator, TetR family [Conexibacter sp.]|jgi:AcrR family transcriptional regulator|nr:transcriptional regulator, TetR family [Conexibacter sp.]